MGETVVIWTILTSFRPVVISLKLEEFSAGLYDQILVLLCYLMESKKREEKEGKVLGLYVIPGLYIRIKQETSSALKSLCTVFKIQPYIIAQ